MIHSRADWPCRSQELVSSVSWAVWRGGPAQKAVVGCVEVRRTCALVGGEDDS